MFNYLKSPKTKIVLILIFAFIIRLAGIASRPIWYDEAFSILLSEQGPSAILSGTLSTDADSSAAEEHPPAYYFTLWVWMQVFGKSIIAARMLSILVSLGSIVYYLPNRKSSIQYIHALKLPHSSQPSCHFKSTMHKRSACTVY